MLATFGRVVLLASLCWAIVSQAQGQTLPASTTDRQAIAQLQFQLGQPGIDPRQRREIEMHIAQLQYQINTRPLIVAPGPISSHAPPPFTSIGGIEPAAQDTPHEPCVGDHIAMRYLQSELNDPQITRLERHYIPNRIAELRHDLSIHGC